MPTLNQQRTHKYIAARQQHPAWLLLASRRAPLVLANTTQIHQVIMNLGINAAHAMRAHGGKLSVRLHQRFVDHALAAELGAQRAKAEGEAQTISDLLVGDVWLCSGQSNMEYPLRRVLAGERDADPLCAALNAECSLIIETLLAALVDPESLRPLLELAAQQAAESDPPQ